MGDIWQVQARAKEDMLRTELKACDEAELAGVGVQASPKKKASKGKKEKKEGYQCQDSDNKLR